MQNLTREAMAAGVAKSCFLILFLSEGVLERPFVLFELGEALKAEKTVLAFCGPKIKA